MTAKERAYLVAELDLPRGSDPAAWADSVFSFLEGLEDPKAHVHGVAAWRPGDLVALPARGTFASTRARARRTTGRVLKVKGELVILLGDARIQYEPAYRASAAQREMRALLRTHADALRASYLAGLGSLRRVIHDVVFTVHDPETAANDAQAPRSPAGVRLSWRMSGGRLLPCASLSLDELRHTAPPGTDAPGP